MNVNRWTLNSFFFGVMILLCTGCLCRAESVCDHVTLEWLKSQVPMPDDTTIVFKKEQGPLCETVITVDGGLAPVYAGPDFIVAGRLYKNGVSITRMTMSSLSDVADAEREKAEEKEAAAAEKRQALLKTHIGELAGLVSMTFAPGRPDRFIYVISDPACSHCKALLDGLEELCPEAGIGLKLIIYPLLGEKSRMMAAHAMCKNLNYAAYKTMPADDVADGCEQADQKIEKTFDLLKKDAQITFVPMVVAEDGSWVVEGNDLCAVREYLGLDPGTGEKSGGCRTDEEE